VLTLGVTPVLAAQLDDPYCLRGMHDWLGSWLLRAPEAGVRACGRWRDPVMSTLAADEHRRATAALADFETRWRHGGSPVLRPLVDGQVIELIGGPATHPFQPLLDPRVREFALRAGLTDTERRLGSRPAGIWAPECGYAPGMEEGYAAAGVRRFLVDGPALRGDTAFARTVGTSDVVCFGRDLPVTYRVWSPRSGYPGGRFYRDFHTYDHTTGLKPSRVTGRKVPTERKKPYDPALAAKAVRRDAADFVKVVHERLTALAAEHGRPALVVAAYDTELFGHWWHEGPEWLGEVLRTLPEAGVRVSTLGGALEAGLLAGPVQLPSSSWGSGKDWRVWDGARVAPLVDAGREVQRQLLNAVDSAPERSARDRVLDGLARQALLALSSDWAFMVTKDSAADYALARARSHACEVGLLAELIESGQHGRAARMVAELDGRDTLFGGLDARGLARPGRSVSRDPEHISRGSVLSGR
jgi:1,4-alpha-glucan branching enzyme